MGALPDQHIILRNIEYGPQGFICKCGGTKFEAKRDKVEVTGWTIVRQFHACLKCGKWYIFVGQQSTRGTIF